MSYSIEAQLVDIEAREVYPARVTIDNGVIQSIERRDAVASDCSGFLMPGFIDSHVHVESSMLTPSQFARIAVLHGTVGTVSDPHEIANVLGVPGVEFMLQDAQRVPFKFCFGAPSCVPATRFESAGATIDVAETERLLDDPRIGYLAEMMNFPGVLASDPQVLAKIQAAVARGKPIDGHAPGLRGDDMRRYFQAGITTDHECFTEAEAIEKLDVGVMVQIREGSAARNFDALYKLIDRYPKQIMFCSDDKHPDDLMAGHINELCRRAVAAGCDLFHVLTAACITPVQHYGLSIGQLRVGDSADMVLVDSLEEFQVLKTFIDGECVAESGQSTIAATPAPIINQFDCSPKQTSQFEVAAITGHRIRVIVAEDRLLTTRCDVVEPMVKEGAVVADTSRDLLKLTVVNRYHDAPPAVAFVRGFGMQSGAVASSVAHDSHNVIGVGTSDETLCRAVNEVIANEGGLSAIDNDRSVTLPLPIAGLMSPRTCEEVAKDYQELDQVAKHLGCALQAPFMTLSFLALLVIPSLKLSDLGLFNGDQFDFVNLFEV